PSSSSDDNPYGGSDKAGDGLSQKTNLYIKECVNRYSNSVMDSYSATLHGLKTSREVQPAKRVSFTASTTLIVTARIAPMPSRRPRVSILNFLKPKLPRINMRAP